MFSKKVPTTGSASPKPQGPGRFQLHELLGEGGFGSVYRASDRLRPGIDLALKLLRPGTMLTDQRSRAQESRAIDELWASRAVEHPAIVETLEIGRLDGEDAAPYILTRFVPGQPLRPPVSADDLLAISGELLSALEAIHGAGWRHGDIQPGNILIERSSDGRPSARLLDFGLAEETLRSARERSRAAGAPRYLSPEALKGLPVDHRADLYSLGVVLLECLCGAFTGSVGDHLLRTRQGKVLEDATRAQLPEPLGRLVRRLLEPDPDSRLPTARAGLEVLGLASHHLRASPSFECVLPVGRDGLIAALKGMLQGLAGPRSRPHALLVEGESGLGRSRVLLEAQTLAFQHGVKSLTWEEARERAKESIARSREAPETADIEMVQDMCEARLDHLAEVLTASLFTRPTILLVDDADQLEEEDLRLLRSILERLQSSRDGRGKSSRKSPSYPGVVICAAPPDPTRSLFLALWRRALDFSWVARHSLLPLTRDESRQFLTRTLRPQRDLGPLEETLLDDADGRPGRLRLRLRELAWTGDLKLDAGTWTLVRPVEQGLPPLPDESARLRVEWLRLAILERDFLAVACVIANAGVTPTRELIAASLRTSAPQLEAALRSLLARPALAPLKGSTTILRLERAHRLQVLRLLGPAARRRLRRFIAECEKAPGTLRWIQALRARMDPPPLSVVLEATGGGGRLVEELLAFCAAAEGVSRADKSSALTRLGEALLERGKLGRAEDALRGALDLAPREPSSNQSARALVLLGECSVARRDGPGAQAWFRKATEHDEIELAIRARAIFGQAASALLEGQLDDAIHAAREGARAWPELPQFLSLLGTAQLARGFVDEAETSLLGAVEVARKRGLQREQAAAQTNLGRLLLRKGRLAEAANRHRTAAKLFEEARSRGEAANALLNLAAALRRSGDFEGAVEAATRSLRVRRELGNDSGIALCEASLGGLARELGLPGTARRRFQGALEAAHGAGAGPGTELDHNLLVLENRALLALDLGNRREAEALVETALPLRGREPTPEELQLIARLARSGEPIVGMRARLRSRAMEERDAPALAALLTQLAHFRTPSSDLALHLRKELERLAHTSDRARFYLETLRAERSSEAEEATAACAYLKAQAEQFPERDARRRAWVAVARYPGTTPEIRSKARGHLRRLLDEVMFDLEPEHRAAFGSREEIQEAMEMASGMEQASGQFELRSLSVLREVFRLNREILEESNVESLVRRAVDAAMALTGAEHGVLFLRRAGNLEIAAARKQGEDMPDPLGSISRTVVDRTLDQGKATITTDAREDLSLRSIASVEELGLRSILCLPLRLRSRVVGALYLDNSFERAVFDPGDLELTESFCAQAMLALRAAEQRQQVTTLIREVRAANQRLEGELKLTRREVEQRTRSRDKAFAGITGDSTPMRRVFQLIEAVGPTEIPVLITGESGTGKELVARAIWQESRRAERPFVAENCAAVPESLLEGALFGHVKGAYTGADSDRPGLFEMADGGTLFLDEISEMPIALQTRLLRVLQEKEVRPIGGKKTLKVDVRVIAATNRDARGAVAQGRLREDLYYRLQGAEIHIPPLRERPEDIPILVERFLAENARGDRPPGRLVPQTLERLLEYAWPGNVRELENEIRRIAVLASGEAIGPDLLSPQVREGAVLRPSIGTPSPRAVRPLAEVEREAILGALKAFDGHRGKAAMALGISRSTLYLKLRAIGHEKE